MTAPTRHLLDIELPPCRSTVLSALRACLSAAGDDRTLAQVAGLTGLAFHLNVDERISPSGVSAYPWAQELPRMVSRLGYDVSVVYSDDEDPSFAAAQTTAVEQAIDAAWRGAPSLLWGVHLPEFGIVRGFDAAKRVLLVSGVLDGRGGPDSIPQDRIGRGDVPILLLATLGARTDVDPREAHRASLRHVLRHAHNLGPRMGGFTAGLDALRAWYAALDSGEIDPAGHAYTLQVTAERRAGVAPFLREAAALETGAAADALTRAAACFARAADAWIALSTKAPFPLPEEFSFSTTDRTAAQAGLETIAAAEREGFDCIDHALDATRRDATTASVQIRAATVDDAPALFHCVRDIPLGGLDAIADDERARVAPSLGTSLRALIAYIGDDVVGHIYFAALADARAPIEVAGDGRYLFMFCPWVAREHGSAGIGKALTAALVDTARSEGFDGVLAEATNQDVFLHFESLAALGFTVVAREADEVVVSYLAVSEAPAPKVRAAESPEPTAGPLRVIVGQYRPCPLLAGMRRNLLEAGARAAAAGAALDMVDRPGETNEVLVGPRRLPLTYIPAEAAEVALDGAARAWQREQT